MITRYAPAPTGWLHLGHVLNAEYVWGSPGLASPKLEERRQGLASPKLEEQRQGLASPKLEERRRVILRIEDHDRERCRPEYDAGILEDLAWLGYRPDVPVVRQSDRGAIYAAAAESLRVQGLLYACRCTRAEIEARTSRTLHPAHPAHPAHPELRYDGHCRECGHALAGGAGWRVRMDPGVERFSDGLLGPQEQDPSLQCGDVLIRDRLGNWTYQFVAAVDDFRQGVDLVIRGIDLLASTGRQMRLARLLGRSAPPEFRHHPLIMKTADQKLSKSDGDTGVRDLRALGWTPEQVKAAARVVSSGV